MASGDRVPALTGILIGDELGQLKRLHLDAGNNITTINQETEPKPGNSIASISQLQPHLFLVAHKLNQLSIYDSLSNHLTPFDFGHDKEDAILVSAQPINETSAVLGYTDGTLLELNLEKDLLEMRSENKRKAIRLLGLNLGDGGSTGNSSPKPGTPKKGNTSSAKDPELTPASVRANQSNKIVSNAHKTVLFEPNWSTTNTCLSCLKTNSNRVAIGGKNFEIKVFDLISKGCIFNGKPPNKDWLGMRPQTWVSDLAWIGGNLMTNTTASMIATCSRSDSVIRIYDLRSRQRKSIMNINLRDSTFNNNSNPPSFTAICSSNPPASAAVPTQQLIVGSTMGRMIAVDVRFNSHSYRTLGVFKGFTGGAIRGIKHVVQGNGGQNKIISCSLDRFVRIHSFASSVTNMSSRHMDSKFYVKTRPTAIEAILSDFSVLPSFTSNTTSNSDDSDFDSSD